MLVILVIVLFVSLFFIFASLLRLINEKRRVILQLKNINKLGEEAQLKGEFSADEGQEEEKKSTVKIDRDKKRAAFIDRYSQKTERKLKKAHLLLRPKEFFMLSAGCAILLVLVSFLLLQRGWGHPAGLLLVILAGGGIGFKLPGIYLSLREKRFKHLLNSQLSNMLLLLSNYLRAGHSVTRGLEMVSREVPSPLAGELKKVIKDINLGGSFTGALSALEKRTEDEDLGMIVTAILIHYQVGGNLSEVLDKINNTIRERTRLKGEIRTLTAQGRLTGIIIGFLPVGVGLMVFLMSPEFVKVLFTEPVGRLMLLFAVIGELAGALLIRRIVEIEV